MRYDLQFLGGPQRGVTKHAAMRMSDLFDGAVGNWAADGLCTNNKRGTAVTTEPYLPARSAHHMKDTPASAPGRHWTQNLRPSRLSFPHLAERIGHSARGKDYSTLYTTHSPVRHYGPRAANVAAPC